MLLAGCAGHPQTGPGQRRPGYNTQEPATTAPVKQPEPPFKRIFTGSSYLETNPNGKKFCYNTSGAFGHPATADIQTTIGSHWALTSALHIGLSTNPVAVGYNMTDPDSSINLGLVRLPNNDGNPLPSGDIKPGQHVTYYGTDECGMLEGEGRIVDLDKLYVKCAIHKKDLAGLAEDEAEICQATGFGMFPFFGIRSRDKLGNISTGPVIAEVDNKELLLGTTNFSLPQPKDDFYKNLIIATPIQTDILTFFKDGDINADAPSGDLFTPVDNLGHLIVKQKPAPAPTEKTGEQPQTEQQPNTLEHEDDSTAGLPPLEKWMKKNPYRPEDDIPECKYPCLY